MTIKTFSSKECSQALEKAGVPPADLLIRYMQALLEINQNINMTGAKSPDELALKHIADVWGALHTLGGTVKRPVVDVGSGAGIPGMILGIFSPHSDIWLLERRQKKASTLSGLVSLLELDRRIKVLAQSFEEIKRFPDRAEFWFRGFLPGGKLATYLSSFDKNAELGTLILMKGPKWAEEKNEIMAQPKVSQAWLERFMSAEELSYELPHGSGKRILVLV